MHNVRSSPTLSGCTFEDNITEWGEGVQHVLVAPRVPKAVVAPPFRGGAHSTPGRRRCTHIEAHVLFYLRASRRQGRPVRKRKVPVRCLTPVVLTLMVVAAAGTQASAAGPEAAALATLIDRHVERKLSSEGLRPAESADDAEFLRRVYLDLHGLVPTREQSARFLSDSHPDKRAQLIDALLASPRYGEYLADLWQGYLISPLADDRWSRADRFRSWLAAQFNTNSWDAIASKLLTTTGRMDDEPAVIYMIEGRHPRGVADLTDLTSRYFLGVRLNCAQCHDHPVVDWRQEDFWGMAAFFAQVQTPGRAKQVYQLGVVDDPRLTLDALKGAGTIDGFQPRPPTFLRGQKWVAERRPARAALADWMTSAENPYFARAAVNRTWWRLFGRGIVQPVDDMHEANPPSHPELLDLLARQFAESGFDLKILTRAIVLSHTYQRTGRLDDGAGEKQAALFGRMSLKVLSAGQLYDSLETIFGPPARASGVKAKQAARVEFVQFFGEDPDADPTAYRRGIPHVLRQMNSGQFTGGNLDGLVARLATPGRPPDELLTDLFLTILSRRPSSKEQSQFVSYLERCGSAHDACREWAWALVMTSEFSLNH